jgi:hypothetical protein|tara:strand:- start:3647 stop:3817 length:171 start_codon:yes stop_codon:yes gene_type:complete
MKDDEYKERERSNRYGILHLVDHKDFITLVIDLVQERPEEIKKNLILALSKTKQKV